MHGTINWLAVLAAGFCSFVIGGIWYSPALFGKAWMKANQFSEAELRAKKKGKLFGWTILFSLLMAFNLAMFLALSGPAGCIPESGRETNFSWGAATGFHAGIWTFCAIAVHSLFEQKSWRLILINGFYSVVSLIIMGAIIGLWR